MHTDYVEPSTIQPADLNSKLLLLIRSGQIVRLWLVNGRVGYLDTVELGKHHWVWLGGEALQLIRSYANRVATRECVQPDFQL